MSEEDRETGRGSRDEERDERPEREPERARPSMGGGRIRYDDMFTLKVDGISDRTTADILREEFKAFGEIGDVYIPRSERDFNSNRGFAFVRFLQRSDMEVPILQYCRIKFIANRSCVHRMPKEALTERESTAMKSAFKRRRRSAQRTLGSSTAAAGADTMIEETVTGATMAAAAIAMTTEAMADVIEVAVAAGLTIATEVGTGLATETGPVTDLAIGGTGTKRLHCSFLIIIPLQTKNIVAIAMPRNK